MKASCLPREASAALHQLHYLCDNSLCNNTSNKQGLGRICIHMCVYMPGFFDQQKADVAAATQWT